jgi:RsiW-degrading membrane proteinase PrsW (M82 family)
MKIKNAAGFVIIVSIYSIIIQCYWFYDRTFGENKEYWDDKMIQNIIQFSFILVPISYILLAFSLINGDNSSEINEELNMSDSLNVGFKILCFLIPIVGLILYIVEKEKNPSKANSAGKCALWGFVISLLIALLSMISIYAIYKNTMSHY